VDQRWAKPTVDWQLMITLTQMFHLIIKFFKTNS